MTAWSLLAAGCAAMASVVLLSSRPRWTGPAPAPPTGAPRQERSGPGWLRLVAAPGAVLAGWSVLGGAFGLLVGVVAAGVVWKALANAEGTAARRRRERLVRDLPLGVELLGSCVRGGAAVEPSLRVVADALGGPLADCFHGVGHRLAIGLDPVSVWRGLVDDPVLAPLGRAVARSHESGASVAVAIDALADDLREQARTEAQVRANAVEVRAAAPLGACFLPAFLLIGVVPLIAGILADISPFG